MPRRFRVIDAKGRLFGKINLIDLGVVGGGLLLVPFFGFAFGSIIQHRSLVIGQVDPPRIVAGSDELITVLGAGFDAKTVVNIGELKAKNIFFDNEARLRIVLPDGVGPGWQTLKIRNGHDRLVVEPKAFEVIWKPMLFSAVPKKVAREDPETITVRGRYLEGNCVVKIGAQHVKNVRYVDSTHLEVKLQAYQLGFGRWDLTVASPAGDVATPPKTIEIVHRLVPKPRPVLESVVNRTLQRESVVNRTLQQESVVNRTLQQESTPVVLKREQLPEPDHTTPESEPELQASTPQPPAQARSKGSFLVICSFPEMVRSSAKRLKAGAVEKDADGKVVVKITEVLSRIPTATRTSKRLLGLKLRQSTKCEVVTASLLIHGEVDRAEDGSLRCFYRGQLITPPVWINFWDFHVAGIVLASPMVVEHAVPPSVEPSRNAP